MGHAAALRRATAALAAAAALLGAGVAARADASAVQAGRADCRFVVPERLPARDVRWSGGCAGGRAEGRGVLRAYAGGRVVGWFYGTLRAGEPVLGVVDLGDGFVAGRFEGARVVADADADRNALIAAFDEAAAAARELAERFRQGGHAASARFYDAKARQLGAQID